MSPLSKRGHVRALQSSEIVRYVKSIDAKALYRFYKSGWSTLREPGGRTPFVIFRQRNDTVPRWIIMNIMQPGEIRALECDVAIPKLKPNCSSRRVIQAVNVLGCLHVKLSQEPPQRARVRRRGSNEVIMIGEYRPHTQVPGKFVRILEQRFLNQIQSRRRIQVWQFPISSRGDDIEARLKQPMGWRVRPVHPGFIAGKARR